jgi:hypothetical protein
VSIEGTFHLLLRCSSWRRFCTNLYTNLALCLCVAPAVAAHIQDCSSSLRFQVRIFVVFIVVVNYWGEDVCVCVKGEMVAEVGRCQSPSPSPSHCPCSPRGRWTAWIWALYTLYQHMYDSNTTILWCYVKSTKLRVSSLLLNMLMCSSCHMCYVRCINTSLSMISPNHYLMSTCSIMMPVPTPSCDEFSLCRKQTSSHHEVFCICFVSEPRKWYQHRLTVLIPHHEFFLVS